LIHKNDISVAMIRAGKAGRITKINGVRVVWHGRWVDQDALFENMVPVCAWCKKIKRGGQWVRGWTRKQPTHGICPACRQTVMAEARAWAQRRAG
jgi:hypothetical protein